MYDKIKQYVNKRTNGLINLNTADCEMIAAIVAGTEKGVVKKYRWSSLDTRWEHIRSIPVLDSVIREVVASQDAKGARVYKYECFSFSGEMIGTIETSRNELFD